MRAVGQADGGRGAADLLHRDAMFQIAHRGAAILLRRGDPEDADFTELAPEIGGEVVVAVDGRRARGDLIGGERRHLVPQRVHRLAKVEIHSTQTVRHGCCSPPMICDIDTTASRVCSVISRAKPYRLRNARRMILPVAVIGSSSTNSMKRGYSCAASRVFTKSCSSATRSGCGSISDEARSRLSPPPSGPGRDPGDGGHRHRGCLIRQSSISPGPMR